MDNMQECLEFLQSLGYTKRVLRDIQEYEIAFICERSEELGIKGMKEALVHILEIVKDKYGRLNLSKRRYDKKCLY